MIERAEIMALIPHQDAMCLWDQILDWDAQRIVVQAHNHRNPAHPLRARGQLHAVHLCEYGAQAMAVHGGLLARKGGGQAPPGMLVALRDVALHVARIDDLPDAIQAEAEVLMHDDNAQQYAFRVTHAGALLAEGRATVMLQPVP